MVKLVLQQPDLVASGYAQVLAVAFTEPAYLAVHEAVLRRDPALTSGRILAGSVGCPLLSTSIIHGRSQRSR